jgi:large subunit ribosomal protein L17
MRHQKKTVKLGRTADHRKALLANQVCSLIEHERIKTTLAKAKAVRPLAERMVTLGKNGSVHARRTALAVLRQKNAVKKLFDNIAPRSAERMGGYTRIIKLGPRKSDSAPVAFLEWVDAAAATEDKEPKKKGKEKSAQAEKAGKTEKTEKAEKSAKPEKAEKTSPDPTASAPVAAQAKEEKPATTEAKTEEKTAAEEPAKPKKRKWFGRKTKE